MNEDTQPVPRVVGFDGHPDSFTAALIRGPTPAAAMVEKTFNKVPMAQLQRWAQKHTTAQDLFVLEASGNSFHIVRSLAAVGRQAKVLESGRLGKLKEARQDKEDIAKELKAAFKLTDGQAAKIVRRITGRARFFQRAFAPLPVGCRPLSRAWLGPTWSSRMQSCQPQELAPRGLKVASFAGSRRWITRQGSRTMRRRGTAARPRRSTGSTARITPRSPK